MKAGGDARQIVDGGRDRQKKIGCVEQIWMDSKLEMGTEITSRVNWCA